MHSNLLPLLRMGRPMLKTSSEEGEQQHQRENALQDPEHRNVERSEQDRRHDETVTSNTFDAVKGRLKQ